MTQLDLSLYVLARTPPPTRWPCSDPELWEAIPRGQAAALQLLQRRHPGDAGAMARDLEGLLGANPRVSHVDDMPSGAIYGNAHVLAWRIRNGKEAVA